MGQFLGAIGLDHSEVDATDTSRRVTALFVDELLSGYAQDPKAILASSPVAARSDVVVVSGIPAATTCPHHLMPTVGHICVGYTPKDRVVGFGALHRLVECFSRRLSFQEQLVQQIADALVEHLDARAAGCIATMAPTCLSSRPPCKSSVRATTVAWAGDVQQDLRDAVTVATATQGNTAYRNSEGNHG